uniref:Uncharacterized protein n=1 Tax=Meloidogyne javanica TaxID=6303 RepID=A0A915N7W5_MELJA
MSNRNNTNNFVDKVWLEEAKMMNKLYSKSGLAMVSQEERQQLLNAFLNLSDKYTFVDKVWLEEAKMMNKIYSKKEVIPSQEERQQLLNAFLNLSDKYTGGFNANHHRPPYPMPIGTTRDGRVSGQIPSQEERQQLLNAFLNLSDKYTGGTTRTGRVSAQTSSSVNGSSSITSQNSIMNAGVTAPVPTLLEGRANSNGGNNLRGMNGSAVRPCPYPMRVRTPSLFTSERNVRSTPEPVEEIFDNAGESDSVVIESVFGSHSAMNRTSSIASQNSIITLSSGSVDLNKCNNARGSNTLGTSTSNLSATSIIPSDDFGKKTMGNKSSSVVGQNDGIKTKSFDNVVNARSDFGNIQPPLINRGNSTTVPRVASKGDKLKNDRPSKGKENHP